MKVATTAATSTTSRLAILFEDKNFSLAAIPQGNDFIVQSNTESSSIEPREFLIWRENDEKIIKETFRRGEIGSQSISSYCSRMDLFLQPTFLLEK